MGNNNINKQTVTVTEAQKILHLNKKAVNNMIISGKLASYKIGNKIQINKNSIRALVQCSNDNCQIIAENVTPSEKTMIADWT